MDLKDLPESFFIGQEYVIDQPHDLMRFELLLYTPAILEPFEVYVQNKALKGEQKGNALVITFDIKLPRKLIDDLAWGRGNSQTYVLGYISRYLPRINQEMLEQRYSSGHYLVRTFSVLDISKITISNLKPEYADEVINVPWPPSFSKFAPVQKIKSEQLDTYLMDFIDAGNDYLRDDYNNCIRRVITSAENAFRFYKLNKKVSSGWRRHLSFLPFVRESSFNTMARAIALPGNLGREVVSENLLFLYKLRNKVTHDKFRIRFENGWICKKAIGTLNYLYQFLDGGGQTAAYVSFMQGQMMMLDSQLKGTTIETLKKMHEERRQPPKPDQIIDSDKKMDEMMFGGLRIAKDEQRVVLKNKVPPNFYGR